MQIYQAEKYSELLKDFHAVKMFGFFHVHAACKFNFLNAHILRVLLETFDAFVDFILQNAKLWIRG